MHVAFTLVSTVLNEIDRLSATISDLENQTLKPAEIVITDAGSRDGTYEELLKWASQSRLNVRILQKQGCNVAAGRNIAIQHASNEIIVSTDFGCRFHPDWLKSMVGPFQDPLVKVVGGNFSVLENELNSWAERAAYICAGGYANVMDESFLPSSRSIAYYKAVWKEVGGYPEELTLAGDDTTFGNRLKAKGFKITVSEKPLVYWLRPSSLRGYLSEVRRYARGDAESRDSKNMRNVIVNSAELLLRILFLVLIAAVLIGQVRPDATMIVLFVLSLFGFRSSLRIFKNWWSLRSRKYNPAVLLYAFSYFDVARTHYIYWYLRTVWKEPGGRLN
jgi:glycosyltransferase involved in cell wall biosynthesis